MDTPCKVCGEGGHLTGACQESNSSDWDVNESATEKKGLEYARDITNEDRQIEGEDAVMALMYFYDAGLETYNLDGKQLPQCHALFTSDSLGNLPEHLSTSSRKWSMADIRRNDEEKSAARDQFIADLKEYVANPTMSANEKVGHAELLPEKVGQKVKEILILEGGENSVAEAFKRVLATLEAGEENITTAIQNERGEFHKEAVEKQLILRSFMKEVYPELETFAQSDIHEFKDAATKIADFDATVDDFHSFVDRYSTIINEHPELQDAVSEAKEQLSEADEDDVEMILMDFSNSIDGHIGSMMADQLSQLLRGDE